MPHMRPNLDIFDEQKNAVLKDAIQLIRVREEGCIQYGGYAKPAKIAEASRKTMLARYASHADSKKQCIE